MKVKKVEEVKWITKKQWLSILLYPIFLLFVFTVLFFKAPYFRVYFFYLALGSFFILFFKILNRRYNTWVVTNLRVIEETGLFTIVTMECSLDKINNVAYSQNICGMLFGFGNVVIQTAALHGATIYYNVSHPNILQEMITTMQEEYRNSAWILQTEEMVEMVNGQKNNYSNYLLNPDIEKLFELKERGILSQ